MHITEFEADLAGDKRNSIVHHLSAHALDGIDHRTHTKPKGEWILPGGELILLQVSGDDRDYNFVQACEGIRSVVWQITVTFSYSDIYDESHGQMTKSLEWLRPRRSRTPT